MTSHAWPLDRRTARVMASIVTGLPGSAFNCVTWQAGRCALAKVDEAKASLRPWMEQPLWRLRAFMGIRTKGLSPDDRICFAIGAQVSLQKRTPHLRRDRAPVEHLRYFTDQRSLIEGGWP